MLRLQIIFNEPRYKMATEFIKRNDNCFLKIPVWIPPVTLDTKKKKKNQTKPIFDTDSIYMRRHGLKKNTVGSSHLCVCVLSHSYLHLSLNK